MNETEDQDEFPDEAESSPGPADRPLSRLLRRLGIFFSAFIVFGFAINIFSEYQADQRLLKTDPDSLAPDSFLVSHAELEGSTAFLVHCASCHGKDLKGSQTTGVPNLTDDIWLYDFGRVSDIERTVLYGIRAGIGRSHNVTDMPAMGLQKALNPDEIKDVIAYTRSLSKHQEDPAAVERGSKIFQDKGVCYDCHSRDATGVSDYGAPNLIDNDWLYGGDEKALYKSIYDGRHGRCPAWIGKLSFATIRSIAVYIHSMSKESPESPTNRSASGSSLGKPG